MNMKDPENVFADLHFHISIMDWRRSPLIVILLNLQSHEKTMYGEPVFCDFLLKDHSAIESHYI